MLMYVVVGDLTLLNARKIQFQVETTHYICFYWLDDCTLSGELNVFGR